MHNKLPLLTIFSLVAGTSIVIGNSVANAQSITTGDVTNEADFCVDVNDNTTVIGGQLSSSDTQSNCTPSPSASPSPTATPTTATPTPTPVSSASPTPTSPATSPQPSTIPSPTPTSTAKSTPTPSSSPGTGDPSTQGKTSSLGYDTNCSTQDVLITFDAKQEGNAVEGVLVKFTYNNETKQVKTNNNGRASVSYRRASTAQSVYADGEGDYPDQATMIKLPNCPNTTTSQTNQDTMKNYTSSTPSSAAGRGGQVLGDTTPQNYAATGSSLQFNQLLALTGGWLSGLGLLLRRKT